MYQAFPLLSSYELTLDLNAAPPPPTKELVCPIPDLANYQIIDGCQCNCVVSWGPLSSAPAPSPVALPPLGPSKKAALIQKLEVNFQHLSEDVKLCIESFWCVCAIT
jgi:hypothetical protein